MSNTDSVGRASDSRRIDSRKSRYPQSTMIRSLLDRRLMALADRGGSSGFVGASWGNYCRNWLLDQVGQQLILNGSELGTVESVLDVDALSGLATFASSRGLQNPDFILTLRTESGQALIATDAKFSLETAKARQVSSEILRALVETPGSPVRNHIAGDHMLLDGFFIGPNYELTDLVLSGRTGILRATVGRSQIILLEVDPGAMLDRPDLTMITGHLAAIDGLESKWQVDLVTALYYTRCAFACIGCRIDEVKPLLGHAENVSLDPVLLTEQLDQRATNASSAWDLVGTWDRDAEQIREIRIRVHQATDIGLMNRDLRTMIERFAERAQIPPPSTNRVRRELAIWTMNELVSELGVVHYPPGNLDGLITAIRKSSARLLNRVPEIVRQIVERAAPA